MVYVQTFTGWFYEGGPEDRSLFLAPPYDSFDERNYRTMLEQSPYNVAHVDLPHVFHQNRPEEEYRKAALRLQRWIREGRIRHHTESAFYWYVHTFRVPSGPIIQREGLLTLVRCEKDGHHMILPHEMTYEAPVHDRMQHLQATGLQASPIFFVYQDESQTLEAEMRAWVRGRTSLVRVETPQGDVHEVWAIDEPGLIADIQRYFTDKVLLIADGHHRYEAVRRMAAYSGDPSWQYAYGYVVNGTQRGLLQMGYHRVVRFHRPIAWDVLMEVFRGAFVLEGTGEVQSLDELAPWLARGEAGPRILMLRGTPLRAYLWRLKPEIYGELDDPYETLGVILIQRYVFQEGLERKLGLRSGDYQIQPTPWVHEVAEVVQDGRYSMALLLTPIPVATLFQLAKRGFRVPPKSTYFYPKAPAGLLMYISMVHDPEGEG